MSISDVIINQREFFKTNKTKDVDFRVQQLKKLKRILIEHESELNEAIYSDFGKSEFETYMTEMSLVFGALNRLIKKTKSWSKKRGVRTNLANVPSRSYIIPEPLGTTLVIAAWNYPLQLSFLPAISSIAAGNTVVLKPSELPSQTSNIIARIVNENFNSDFFKVIEGGVEETTELLKNKFDKIFFTGSVGVGKIVYKAAAEHLTPVTLELGGKSPAFVMQDCKVNMTAKRIVWSKFLNAGQTCIAPDYILVENSIREKLLLTIKEEILKYHGQTFSLKENYTRIIDDRHFDRLVELIDKDKVFFGGGSNKEERIIQPTILHNVTFDDKIMEDEIFGPILPVIGFDDFDTAVLQVKERPKPLACYIFSKKRKTIKKLFNELSFGGGAVNDCVTHVSNHRLPFGGVGQSGMGSYHGKTGFDNFSHFKSILERPLLFEPNIKYPPYSGWKKTTLKRLLE